MTAAKTIRIGSSAGAWGDTTDGVRQLVRDGQLDFLVGDYLAEVTMAILARIKAKNPDGGFIPDWLNSVHPYLSEIREKGIKLITNSGGMNPLACRDAFVATAREMGIEFNVAVVVGDDLMDQAEAIRAGNPEEMFNGDKLPDHMVSMNAYLGAAPIAEALRRGADVVITGRCVDSALVLGPLIYTFDWDLVDYDKLAAGSLAGHIVECGTQATGGLFTDWQDVADDWHDMGFPIVECQENGEFVVGKPPGSGGKVSLGTIGEQMLYEIGNPQAYELPDVSCDFSLVKMVEIETDRVRVSNVKGRPPGKNYKVCGTYGDGFRILTTYMIAGWQADRKAYKTAEAMIRRCRRLMQEQGFADFSGTDIEVIGAEHTYGENRQIGGSREVIVKIGLRHENAKALNVFAKEFAVPALAMAQGTTGLFGGRPKPVPVIAVYSFLIDKSEVPVDLVLDSKIHRIQLPPVGDASPVVSCNEIETASQPQASATVPLRALAWGRSGDKGDHANIGLIARQDEFAPYIKSQITAEVIADFFSHYLRGPVSRYELPGIKAFNFLLEDVLGGGGTASLRYDPQAKTFAQMVLDIPVAVPDTWLATGGRLADFAADN